MTLVAGKLYRDGVAVETCLSLDALPRPDGPSDLLWIGLVEPSEGELAQLARHLPLHPLALEDALKAHQLPKVDIYDDHLFVVLYTAGLGEDDVRYGETSMFVGANFIITARHASPRDHISVRADLERSPNLLAMGSDYVLHAIVDHIADGYFPVTGDFEERAMAMEDRALENFLSPAEVHGLFGLRRQIARFQRKIEPMRDVASKLAHVKLPFIDAGATPYFNDVDDHVRRALHQAAEVREQLSGIIETSSMMEQHRQGDTTRRLAAWAAILAVPTAIAGIYGMNFDDMPELRQPWGYPAVLMLMGSICGTLYWRFRRSGWL